MRDKPKDCKKINTAPNCFGEKNVFRNIFAHILCAFFALGMVVGYSFYKTESLSLIWNGSLRQFGLAFLTWLGWDLLFLLLLALGQFIRRKKPNWFRRKAIGRVESFLFEEHSFLAPLLFFLLCSLPYMIFFFPGTVAPDARGQLWNYFAPVEMNGHHPVGGTMVMGWFVELGRNLFDSDNIGIFFYTGLQSLLQSFVMAYMVHYQKALKAPLMLRWSSLVYFGILPLFPMWGFTMIKDTIYYITFAVMILSAMDYLRSHGERNTRSAIMLTLSTFAIVVFRNEGRYVVFVTLALLLLLARKYWKDICIAALLCVAALFLIEGVYMPANGIKKGPIKEMLSLPLQQTGRYIWLHGEEITDEEREVLEAVFIPEVHQVGYVKETSDCVKGFFEDYPDDAALKAYFQVWLQQGLKHPGTYAQATLNQMYGYFYPPRRDIREEFAYFGFTVDTALYMDRDYVEAHFEIADGRVREAIKTYVNTLAKTPVLGLLYTAGTHSFLLMGMVVYLLYKKRGRDLSTLVPGGLVLLIAIASPLNASIRYMLPVMFTLPMYVAWCAKEE